MAYFVTGGTGFIGKFLIQELLKREEPIYVLVREQSLHKLAYFEKHDPNQRIKPVVGNICDSQFGLSDKQYKELQNQISHFYHLAAIYDLQTDAASQQKANVDGTQYAVMVAQALGAQCFHMVSSIAAAGLYRGIFREDMFEEAEQLNHPYFATKHRAEKIVRDTCEIPYRIYRPGMVIGHSETGEIDKIDGPYYFFKMIQKFRKSLPSWVPTIGIEGGYLNLVPVDYVVRAMDHISHQPDLDGQCFHLTDPKPHKIGEALNIFADAGHAPKMAVRLDTRLLNYIPPYVRQMISSLPPIRRIKSAVLSDWGIPEEVMSFMNYPTKFDNRATRKALEGTDIQLPPLKKYAGHIWDYWERNLDPDLFIAKNLQEQVQHKNILITGATSGIGLALAKRLSSTKAHLILVARNQSNLEEIQAALSSQTATISTYSCDLTNMDDTDALVQTILEKHERVDILVNNAGRSIRRSIENSADRFHDYTRTMQLNYFGCLKLIMGFLPGMSEQQCGHIINISSIGVLTNAPRFSAYVASKAALEAFTRCAAAEYSDTGVKFTTVNMPLVKTPMIAPTRIYDYFPTLSPEQAANMIAKGIVDRPKRVATRLGIAIQVLYYIFPRVTEILFNFTFRMFKDSAAAKGDKEALKKESGNQPKELSSEQIAISQFMRGIHL